MHLLRSVRTYIFAALLVVLPAAAFGGIGISVTIAPPVLPVYTQPVCPGDGYIWTPGYWAYGPEGYYWVAGTWVLAPQPGLLWTPGYWGFSSGAYLWHAGYWGPHVGFYGGVDYGYGYGGVGFVGGRWDHGHFFYNTAVSRVNVTVIHNVYHTEVIHRNVSRVSYNGPGGRNIRPTAEQERFDHERHFERTPVQVQHEHMASTRPDNFASRNHGRPSAPAMSRPMNAHNVPRPGNPHENMKPMAPAHNTNVPRPANGGFHGNANNGHPNNPPHNEAPHNMAPHNEPAHNQPHNMAPHNGAPHNMAPHNEPAHGGGGHPEPEHKDHH
ncbi:MAG TPA: hypothetical protein VGG46_11065 [Terriglobales bacterium]